MTTRFLAFALCLAATASPLAAQPASSPTTVAATPSDAQALAGLDEAIAEMLIQWRVPGVAVSIVRDGRVVLARGYGHRNPDTRAPMSENTIFPIASMSKAFASFSAGLLVDEGRMDFDAPVGDYIADLRFADPAAAQGLTLRDMLSHRSGMPRHDAVWYHNAALTRAQLADRVPHLPFSAPLRTRFQYNNIMFVLSGLAVDRVTGSAWEQFVEQRIFRPLAMTRSGFSPDAAMADPDHADGREVLNGQRTTVSMFRNTPILNPAGGVYSTATDLASWMQVHLSNGQAGGRQLIQPATLADMHRMHMPRGATVRDPELLPGGYGLGWFVDTYRGQPMVHHGGNLPGSSTMVALLPQARLGVTVLVNHGGSELRDALTNAILDRFLGVTGGRDWVAEALARTRAAEAAEVTARGNRGATRTPNTRPDFRLADYAGTYQHAGYGPLIISVDDGRLVARYNDDRSPLEHFHYEVFDATTTDPVHLLTDARMQFESDMFGRVAALRVSMESTLPPATFARQPDARLSDPAYLARLAGTYELAGTRITIAVTGSQLSWTSAGGQPALLLPALAGEFQHSRRRDARIQFVHGPAGPATAVRLIDTSGIYEARRLP